MTTLIKGGERMLLTIRRGAAPSAANADLSRAAGKREGNQRMDSRGSRHQRGGRDNPEHRYWFTYLERAAHGNKDSPAAQSCMMELQGARTWPLDLLS